MSQICDRPGLLPVDDAISELLAGITTRPPSQPLPLAAAAGRVLASDLRSPLDMPAWDNSAMDGYAVASADFAPEQRDADGGRWLPLGARVAAGDQPAAFSPGQACRIFTGAPLPAGADSVIVQEQARNGTDRVWLPTPGHGDNVRRRGEEFARGTVVLPAGHRLRAPEMALLASLGLTRIDVFTPLRVGLLSTGNELRAGGQPLATGQLHDANGPGLAALLRGWGMAVVDGGIVPDRPEALRTQLAALAAACDVVVTTGGVSVGEEDHLKSVVSELGAIQRWRLALQPGKPLAFGHIDNTPWLGLPGNPGSALVTALIIARPYLLRLQGQQTVLPQAFSLPAGFDWPRARPRRQYLRARLQTTANHALAVVPHAQQGSAMLRPACESDGLALVEVGRTLASGEPVPFLPYAALLS